MACHIKNFFHTIHWRSKINHTLNFVPFKRLLNVTSSEMKVIHYQNKLFSDEQKRQFEDVGRIEKISVFLNGPPEDVVLYMNKELSTPYDCARHISQDVVMSAGLALVDSDKPWDMHRPLISDCKLKFLMFDDEDPTIINKAFWESCCFILGRVIKHAFKDYVSINLYHYPPPLISVGSFAYDAQLSLEDWHPTSSELRVLTGEAMKFCNENHKFERLNVSEDLALEIMSENPFKKELVKKLASKSEDNKVTLYRVGDFIDISTGPLISNTNLVNRWSVTAVHRIDTNVGPLYRFQGLALPKPIMLNDFAYSVLENRAQKLISFKSKTV